MDALKEKESEEREARLFKLRPAPLCHISTANELFARHSAWKQALIEAEGKLVTELKRREVARLGIHAEPTGVYPSPLVTSTASPSPQQDLPPAMYYATTFLAPQHKYLLGSTTSAASHIKSPPGLSGSLRCDGFERELKALEQLAQLDGPDFQLGQQHGVSTSATSVPPPLAAWPTTPQRTMPGTTYV